VEALDAEAVRSSRGGDGRGTVREGEAGGESLTTGPRRHTLAA